MWNGLNKILAVGIGGFIGSISRYLISGWIQQFSQSGVFPWGTFFVNILGCFLIGIIGALSDGFEFFNSTIRILIMIGILGGFTTFSSFGYESFHLIRNKELFTAMIYMVSHFTLGIIFAWIGYTLIIPKG
ncbi:MAG: fluoride efflux transporter CrcB [Candidatus Marinimicrobia bacterium]|nr:fluoride efflux transporter CrcB [Candidatus Neomarinimicrobiota bacterium]